MKIKGFDKNMCCRGKQYKVGEIYSTDAKDDELELCTKTVIHYCDSAQKVHGFYPVDSDNIFCEIAVLGAEVTDGEKFGSNKIKILRIIEQDELNILVGKINGNTGLFNSGHMNSGDRNSGHMNSGDRNSGHRNSGDRNSGHRNSGDRNSGHRNSGDMNSGDMNSGDMNSGHMNSGVFNSCDYSNGVFCSTEPKISIFNIQTDMTLLEFYNSKYWNALCEELLEITYIENDELKTRDYKEACRIWWDKTSDKSKKIIQQMPNFNKEIFCEITGVRL